MDDRLVAGDERARQVGLCGEVCGKVIIKEEGRSRNAASLSRF